MLTSDAWALPENLHLALRFRDFAAQAIEAREPARRGRPFVVVRQSAASHRSSVFSRSRRARELGVEAGAPVFVARRRLPALEVVLRRPDYEEQTCGELQRLTESVTPAYSCDASDLWLLDLTGTPVQRERDPRAFAESFRGHLYRRLGLSGVTIGVSRSELVARMQTAVGEVDQVCVCEPGQENSLLAEFEARHLPGLSRACRALLEKYGLAKVGQIRLLGRRSLVKRFGTEGEKLFELVRGISSGRSGTRREGLFMETVLDWDIVDRDILSQCVRYTADKLCYELRRRETYLSSFALAVRYSDGARVQRSKTLVRPTQTYLDIADAATELFQELCQRRIAIKSIAIRASRTRPETAQLDLFESNQDRRSRSLGRSIRAIRDRTGFAGILTAAMLPVYQRDPAASGPLGTAAGESTERGV